MPPLFFTAVPLYKLHSWISQMVTATGGFGSIGSKAHRVLKKKESGPLSRKSAIMRRDKTLWYMWRVRWWRRTRKACQLLFIKGALFLMTQGGKRLREGTSAAAGGAQPDPESGAAPRCRKARRMRILHAHRLAHDGLPLSPRRTHTHTHLSSLTRGRAG